MKKIFVLLFITIMLHPSENVCAQVIQISGNIYQDAIWEADTIKLTGDVFIQPNVLLTIRPGTYIQSLGKYKLQVAGSIIAEGTHEDSIHFISKDTSEYWNPSYNSSGWKGLELIGNADFYNYASFEFCSFKFVNNSDSLNTNKGALFVDSFNCVDISRCYFKKNFVMYHPDKTSEKPQELIPKIRYTSEAQNLTHENYAGKGGAVFCINTDTIRIIKNTFCYNKATLGGGAICIDEKCPYIIIDQNTFYRNECFEKYISPVGISFRGPGCCIKVSDPFNDAITSQISNNFCYNNRGVTHISISALQYEMYNNVLVNNYGTAIISGHQRSSGKIFNNTIANNLKINSSFITCGNEIIYNNISWNNVNAPDMQTYIDLEHHIFSGNPTKFSNCFEKGNPGINGTNQSPAFINPSDTIGFCPNAFFSNWGLKEESSCINAGVIDTFQLCIPSTDFHNNPRIMFDTIDIGAIEFQGTTGIIDANLLPIIVFPNPAKDIMTIKSDEQFENFKIEIINIYSGLECSKILQPYKNEYQISIAHLPAGMYILRIQTDKGFVTKKFTKL